MGRVLRLIETGVASPPQDIEVMEISRLGDLGDISNLGADIVGGEAVSGARAATVVTAQAGSRAVPRPGCSGCGGRCHVNDWRLHPFKLLNSLSIDAPTPLRPTSPSTCSTNSSARRAAGRRRNMMSAC